MWISFLIISAVILNKPFAFLLLINRLRDIDSDGSGNYFSMKLSYIAKIF